MSIVGGRVQLYFQFNKDFMGIASQKLKEMVHLKANDAQNSRKSMQSVIRIRN